MRLRVSGYVADMRGAKYAFRILMEKHLGKWSPDKPKRRREDNTNGREVS
jgi:hypothetical protein